ncbi:MAG: response regulator with CheY-like receiver domain and winged-helix DNA-binding domain [Candidatus Saganbacteria bacterium]|uniref:Response regulator with CheY-like receiver domain and winged-helix DNA-binding domain n=1 Tax=Candidatus Saganbacteria bacterium TaxID=2575572 RepID=A0A833L0G8_UNCSA|nr:MAG: response regulator with CheY-like receiver domain and winged-helix DNA-binding domain [Candidatus Saganbacteria bacterium]
MPKKILVVDDEEDIINTLTIRLKSNGYDVISASDGMSALSKAREEKPDLILLDIMLPKLDGYKVCRMLKFDENYKNIPIIMITAKVAEQDKKMGAEVGADAYLVKPFNPEELLRKVNELISKETKVDG